MTTDPAALDLDVVHAQLAASYWAPGVPRDVVERSFAASLAFALQAPDGSLAGFARVVTDRAVFAHLADVLVLEAHRGRGLGTWLVERVLAHPDLQGLRRIQLHTADAHALYARFGFKPPEHPDQYLVLQRDPAELYAR